jgi:hypothetical protein
LILLAQWSWSAAEWQECFRLVCKRLGRRQQALRQAVHFTADLQPIFRLLCRGQDLLVEVLLVRLALELWL